MNKRYSDRGKISQLSNKQQNVDIPISDFESRLLKLYNIAINTKNSELEEILGFITYPGYNGEISPVSIYRLKEVINKISSKQKVNIDELSKQFSQYFILPEVPIKKKASSGIFRRV